MQGAGYRVQGAEPPGEELGMGTLGAGLGPPSPLGMGVWQGDDSAGLLAGGVLDCGILLKTHGLAGAFGRGTFVFAPEMAWMYLKTKWNRLCI